MSMLWKAPKLKCWIEFNTFGFMSREFQHCNEVPFGAADIVFAPEQVCSSGSYRQTEGAELLSVAGMSEPDPWQMKVECLAVCMQEQRPF
eukprot:308448-Pelagomonas_calceolata.AAC.3